MTTVFVLTNYISIIPKAIICSSITRNNKFLSSFLIINQNQNKASLNILALYMTIKVIANLKEKCW